MSAKPAVDHPTILPEHARAYVLAITGRSYFAQRIDEDWGKSARANAAHYALDRRSLPGLSGPLGLDDRSIPTE